MKRPMTPYKRRQIRRQVVYNSLRLLFLVLFFAGWELAAQTGVIDPFLLSSPSRMVACITGMGTQLLSHLGITVGECLVGFFVGSAAGAVFAAILWFFPRFAKFFEPFLVVINALPKVALGPVIILLVGAGPAAIITMALAISMIVTVLGLWSGFCSCDTDWITMATSFKCSRLQLFFHIVFPAGLPALISSLKIVIGLSLVGVITGEFLVSKGGLGYLIVYGGQVFRMDLVMSSVFILAALAALMYAAVALFEKLCIPHFQS